MSKCCRRRRAQHGAALVATLAVGCTPAPSPPPVLAQHWMIGLERMRGDALFLAPYTNRFLATLAAMPMVQVVYLGADQNEHLFGAWTAPKLHVYPALRAEGACMQITYTKLVEGQLQTTYGLVIPALPAGAEPDPECVDRAASDFYSALTRQGL